jgi:serpin B
VVLPLVVGCGVDAAPVPAADKADRTEAAQGNNAFALDLYGHLRARPGNLFFSPHSIRTALGMTYAGARGQTAAEMARALHFNLPPERLHPALGALVRDLSGTDKKRGYQLNIANALWAQKDYTFLPEFLKLIHDQYHAALEELDFAGNTEQARKTINDWVEKQTQDKIKDLLPPGVLDSRTRLVLTNAIYFKGTWASPFKKNYTHDAPFHLAAKQDVNVPMMNQKESFPYFQGDRFQVLELPYAGKDLSMVIFLPKEVDGLADFEKNLTAEKLAGWLGRLREQEVVVSLPRFKVTAEFSLKDTLSSMGMAQAFSSAADFSGMDGKLDLWLSNVIHKAFVDVNEEGTEAAAATGVIVAAKAVLRETVFRADHPFLFLIRERRSGSILFQGRVVNPQA